MSNPQSQRVTQWLPGSGGGRGGEVQSLVMAAQHCERPKNHSTVHFKMVIFILCEFYLNLKGENEILNIPTIALLENLRKGTSKSQGL